MIARHGRRILSCLSLLLFLIGNSGDLLSRHLCPHHDADVLAATESGHHGHQKSHSSDQDHNGCTCIGHCVQNSAALPAVANATPAVAPIAITESLFRARKYAHMQPQHLLPFANAPPVIA